MTLDEVHVNQSAVITKVGGEAFLSFLTFVLLYTPCVATVATMRKELGPVWKTAVVVVYQCALAWVCSCMVYQIAAAC